MTLDDLHEYVVKQFATMLSRVGHIDHVQGNLGNMLNLFIAQEERLKNNISYLLTKAVMVLEDQETPFSGDYLVTCLRKLELLKDKIREKMREQQVEVPVTLSQEKNEDNEG